MPSGSKTLKELCLERAMIGARLLLILRFIAVLLPVSITPAHAMALGVEKMTINGRSNPLGIGASDISLSWAIAEEVGEARGVVQTAYQVRIGTTEGGEDLWDSGRVTSDRQVGIPLPAQLSFTPATRYYWQVKIWDGSGVASQWSTPQWFETGLLSGADWKGAQWITRQEEREWSDYAATIEFTVNEGALGVLLRTSRDGRNAYMDQINVSGTSPLLVLHRKINGQYSVMASVDLAPFGFTNGTLKKGRHRLEVELEGPQMITHLDGKAVDSRTNNSFAIGDIGFRTYGPERATLYGVKVVEKRSRRVLLEANFDTGHNAIGGLRSQGGTGTPKGFSGSLPVTGTGRLISGNTEAIYGGGSLLPLLRGTFEAAKEVRSARIYASALGLYELSLNGKKVGDQFLAPGWTDYNQRIQSQTYDVTDLVRKGRNVIGGALGDGWYKGKVGIGWNKVYGDTPSLIAKVKVTYEDGSVDWFGTNEQWASANSPFLVADLQDGETYDANMEQPGWNTPAFDASKWGSVRVVPCDPAKLVPQPDEPVRVTGVLSAKTRTASAAGGAIYDLGQNMVGVARLTMTGKKGQTVKIRYAEELYRTGDRQGEVYTDNFRTAKVTDYYTFSHDGTVTYEPTFTQHGFRYVELTGLDKLPEPGEVKGMVHGSDLPNTGDLETSNPMLNQLVRNIRWGQRGNFVSIPTDTPARDERLGWTGDISVFAPTASFYQDTRAFLSKWMDDVRDSQRENGNIPAVVPQPRNEFGATGVGWSDAVITVPYAVWKATGDDSIVRRNWAAMKKFYRFVHESATQDGNLLEEGRSCWFSGDWLNLEKVDRLQEHKVIATAYFAENTRMMAEMAAAIGETAEANAWESLVPQIRQAFTDAYVSPEGSVYTKTQTVCAMALGMDLVSDPAARERVAHMFVEKIAADGYHLKTGFLGTPWLLPALTRIGRQDLAFRLLLNEDYPSWGFEVKMGATTMWERWNTINAKGEFGPVSMNSFNHYAYGAVAAWMFQQIGGLQAVEAGYKKSRIAPLVGMGGFTSAKAVLNTPSGLLSCNWRLAGGSLSLEAVVPPNTSSEIVIPAATAQNVYEGGNPATSASGLISSEFKDGQLILRVGSGHYKFSVGAPRNP